MAFGNSFQRLCALITSVDARRVPCVAPGGAPGGVPRHTGRNVPKQFADPVNNPFRFSFIGRWEKRRTVIAQLGLSPSLRYACLC